MCQKRQNLHQIALYFQCFFYHTLNQRKNSKTHMDESIPLFFTHSLKYQLQIETFGSTYWKVVQNNHKLPLEATYSKWFNTDLYICLDEAFEIPASQQFSIICLIKQYFQHYE